MSHLRLTTTLLTLDISGPVDVEPVDVGPGLGRCGGLTLAGSWEQHPENIVEREPDLSRLGLNATRLALNISGPVDVGPGLGGLQWLDVRGILRTAP